MNSLPNKIIMDKYALSLSHLTVKTKYYEGQLHVAIVRARPASNLEIIHRPAPLPVPQWPQLGPVRG